MMQCRALGDRCKCYAGPLNQAARHQFLIGSLQAQALWIIEELGIGHAVARRRHGKRWNASLEYLSLYRIPGHLAR